MAVQLPPHSQSPQQRLQLQLFPLLVAAFLIAACSSAFIEPPFEKACPQEWPELDLVMPTTLHNDFWKRFFLPSLLLFWPLEVSKTGVVFVLDGELRGQNHLKHFTSTIESYSDRVPGGMRVEYHPPSPYYGSRGYDRQQYLAFYPEDITTKEYVGFVDTDTVFFTYVALTDLFEGGKPVIHGRSGPFGKEEDPLYVMLWQGMSAATWSLLGIKEPTRCMSYFPVVIKAAHLIELRAFLERKYGKPFHEIFLEHLAGKHYSQFNIMCTYLWAFHKKEYVWYIHELKPNWDYISPPAWVGQETDLSLFSEEMKYPKPRIAIHAKYHDKPSNFMENPMQLQDTFAVGMCATPPLPRVDLPFCSLLKNYSNVLIDDFFKFEGMNWNLVVPYEDRIAAQQFRYAQIAACNHTSREFDRYKVMPELIQVHEGSVYWTKSMGRAIYLYTKGMLRRIPNWDTYLGMKLPEAKGITQRVFTLLPMGPDLPSL